MLRPSSRWLSGDVKYVLTCLLARRSLNYDDQYLTARPLFDYLQWYRLGTGDRYLCLSGLRVSKLRTLAPFV
ncbi:MAG: hypothetical protein IGR76_07245 [Synechococcales cyanobacterium T60_A2020_003]|nr:hypothetical protein [Synechococcales cyanobacterium T60_A2020_003]